MEAFQFTLMAKKELFLFVISEVPIKILISLTYNKQLWIIADYSEGYLGYIPF